MGAKPPKQNVDVNRILKNVPSDLRDILLVAHEQKFVLGRTKNHHVSITTPRHWREHRTVFAPGTPSDTRGLHRVRAKLRRIGVQLPH